MWFVGHGQGWAGPTVRVEVLRAPFVTVNCPDEFHVNLSDGKPIFLGRFATFRIDPEGISINGRSFKIDVFHVVAHGLVEINKHHYHGDFRIRREADLLEIVNVVDLEKYLWSVVGSEMSSRWPLEALKAQAVVARTYALKKMEEHKSLSFDVLGSYEDQAYEGTEGESPATEEAVTLTQGEVLTHQGEIITSYYHADCGGRTEKGTNVFSGDLPYLQSVICAYGQDSPYRHWTKAYSLAELSERLGRPIQSISLVKDPESQRIEEVVLENGRAKDVISGHAFRKLLGTRDVRSTQFEMTQTMKTVYVSKEEVLPPQLITQYVATQVEKAKKEIATVHLALGEKAFLIHRTGALVDVDVSSANPLVAISNGGFLYTVYQNLGARTVKTKMVPDTIEIPRVTLGPPRKRTVWVPTAVPVAVTFEGRGWGHGVGLCQWGSRGMALQGKTYLEILHHYYRNVELKKEF